jgi:hypothetical protein
MKADLILCSNRYRHAQAAKLMILSGRNPYSTSERNKRRLAKKKKLRADHARD